MGEVQAIEIIAKKLTAEQKDFLEKWIKDKFNEPPVIIEDLNGSFTLEWGETDYMSYGIRHELMKLKEECQKRGIKASIYWATQQDIVHEELEEELEEI